MGGRTGRVLVATTACLLWLNGCETSTKLGDLFSRGDSTQTADGDPGPTGSIAIGNAPVRNPEIVAPEDFKADQVPKGLLGNDPNDDLNLGKKYFRSANFGLAEQHFRRAVEAHPRDLESWVGLAASYDRLRRWDLADRAYDQAFRIGGPTGELLNNKGYSLMLRGDYRRARETFMQAQAKDPSNPYIKNNLELLETSYRKGKAVQ